MADPMAICVAGWYLGQFEEFYSNLHRLNKKYRVHVVSNKDDRDFLDSLDLDYSVRGNTGLEWGAYNYYLMGIWDGKSSVLFCHDDIKLKPVVVNGEIQPPEWVFDKIAAAQVDQAYIFGSRSEDVENYGQHGRMVFMSRKFLSKCRELGGFWYDGLNRGHVSADDVHLKDEFKCLGYNAGIISFHAQAKTIGGRVHAKIFIPSFILAKRGDPSDEQTAYNKWLDKIDAIIARDNHKLNIGCGDQVLEGYLNVDLYNPKADAKMDGRDLPLSDGSMDLIESHHFIEHLTKDDAKQMLAECKRVLKPGGHLLICCPDIISMIDALRQSDGKPELWDGFMDVIYRTHDRTPGACHKFGYSAKSLKKTLEDCGFEDVEVKIVVGLRPTPSLLAFAHRH